MAKRRQVLPELPETVKAGKGQKQVQCSTCGLMESVHLAIMTKYGPLCSKCYAEYTRGVEKPINESAVIDVRSFLYKGRTVEIRILSGKIGKDTNKCDLLIDGVTVVKDIPFTYRSYAQHLYVKIDGMSYEAANEKIALWEKTQQRR